jgi:hypothetical protein
MRFFEIAPDCQDLANRGTVVQYQSWNDKPRVDRSVRVGKLSFRSQIDQFGGDRDAFLSQKNADTARIGRERRLKKFHGVFRNRVTTKLRLINMRSRIE